MEEIKKTLLELTKEYNSLDNKNNQKAIELHNDISLNIKVINSLQIKPEPILVVTTGKVMDIPKDFSSYFPGYNVIVNHKEGCDVDFKVINGKDLSKEELNKYQSSEVRKSKFQKQLDKMIEQANKK